jgi:hypothetical protein
MSDLEKWRLARRRFHDAFNVTGSLDVTVTRFNPLISYPVLAQGLKTRTYSLCEERYGE